jgi:hypothetical protein
VNGNTAVNPNVAAAPAILSLPDTQPATAIGTGLTPAFYWDKGKPFLIQGAGICKTGVSANLTLKLYQVPASILATLANGSVAGCNLLASSSARAVNSTTGNFIFQAELQWNAVTGVLGGAFTDTIINPSNSLVDPLAAVTVVTTATLADNELNFLLSATLSSGNAANAVTLMEFAAMNV